MIDGLCVFGSHDGWVYALNAADGSLAWRFMAAPYERKMAVNGQLESTWPVYGVTLHEGLACFSAGLHPETGGGIFVYGVEPKTGKLAWKRLLRKGEQTIEGQSKYKVVVNRIVNAPLKSEGGRLVLPGISFTPQETDEQIRAKVEGPAEKK